MCSLLLHVRVIFLTQFTTFAVAAVYCHSVTKKVTLTCNNKLHILNTLIALRIRK